jgi:hypothetical protein
MKIPAVFLAIFACALALSAQAPPIEKGSKVFIEPMNGFENYLTAAFEKKGVPLTVVADETQADYVMSGTSEDKKPGAVRILVTGNIHGDNAASVRLVDKKSGAVVFAYAVNKKDTLHGDQTTAEACAKHLKDQIEKPGK